MVIIFAKVFACRLEVDQQRHLVADFLPIVIVQWHAQMPCNPVQMDRRICGAANGGVDGDRIFERFPRHHVRWFQIFVHHFNDALASGIGHLPTFPVRGWNSCGTRQLHAQRLSQRIHRRSRAHGVAIAGRRCGRSNQLHKAFIVNFTGRMHFAGFPDDRARPGPFPPEPAVQHGPD